MAKLCDMEGSKLSDFTLICPKPKLHYAFLTAKKLGLELKVKGNSELC